jgi:hypothetical protein
MDGELRDEKLVALFEQWLAGFEVVAAEEVAAEAEKILADVELCISATPAEGLRGLVVKLGLHQFLSDQGDPESVQAHSAYCDLVRLTGHDPTAEIFARFQKGNPVTTVIGD